MHKYYGKEKQLKPFIWNINIMSGFQLNIFNRFAKLFSTGGYGCDPLIWGSGEMPLEASAILTLSYAKHV